MKAEDLEAILKRFIGRKNTKSLRNKIIKITKETIQFYDSYETFNNGDKENLNGK